MRGGALFRAVAGVLLLALALNLNAFLERRALAEVPAHSLYLPSGKYLRYATLGYREVVADLLYVWSIQYYSTVREDRWRYLARFYEVITDLDPRFLTAYSIGALILALEAGSRPQALELLEKGMRANPDTFYPAWEAAFYARDMGQLDRQVEYFRIAMEKPDAPPFIRRWYQFALAKAGGKEEALALWKETYESAESDYERRIASRYIHTLTVELDIQRIREAIERFRRATSRCPVALDELVRAGLLRVVPVGPDGAPYAYDRIRCDVHEPSGSLRERLQ